MAVRELVVVPDAERVEQWLADAAAEVDFVDARGVCTLGQLVERCEPARWAGLVPAEPVQVRLTIAALAPPLAERHFGVVARSAEFAAQAQELFTHLRAQGAGPAQLRAAAREASGPLAARAGALAALLERLDLTLAARGQVDPGELVRLAAERLLKDGLPPRLAGPRAITVRHVHDLFPARLALLEALARACQRAKVRFTVHWPSSGSQPVDLFVLDALRTMEARWQELEVEAFPEVSEAPLAWVCPAAFADEPSPRPAPELERWSAPTPRAELRQLAARARQAIDQGTPPERIAIAFRDLADDTEGVIEALAELGVPARGRLGVPLPATPPGRFALSLFGLLDDGFPAERLADLLEARYAQVLEPGAAPPRQTFRQVGVRDALVGAQAGRDAYEVRLADAEGRARSEAEREGLVALRRSVAHATRLMRSIPEEGRASELLDAWWDALTKLGLFAALSERPEPRGPAEPLELELDRAVARDQGAGEALRALLTTLQHGLKASGLGAQRLTRRELLRHVRRSAEDLNVLARGPRAGAVWLLDARELGGRRFDLLLVGGLVDGRFPGRPTPLALLSDEERATLNRLAKAPLFRLGVSDGGVRLPTRLAEDRLLLHLALCAAPRVVLSRARADATGKEQLPSPFLDALDRVLQGQAERALPRVAVPPLDQVGSEAALRTRLALELFSPQQTRLAPRDARAAALEGVVGAEPWCREARHVGAAEHERLVFFSMPSRDAGRFTGRVDGWVLDAVRAQLSRGPSAPISANELKAWGACGFAGLVRLVLRGRQLDEVGEELDARARGSLHHEVLREVVPELQRRGLLHQPELTAAELRPAVEAAVATVAARLSGRVATGHPLLWELARERTATLLRRFLAKPELRAPFGAASVLDVELDFGPRARVPELREVRVPAVREGEEDVYLYGRIDRVDGDGAVTGVVDYKSSLALRSALATRQLVDDFQMPVYLLAVRQWRAGTALDAAWLGVNRREQVHLAAVLGADASVETLLATDGPTRAQAEAAGQKNLANEVHGLLGRLRQGDFGPRPTDCRYCELRATCRISERRLTEDA